jgi:murein DD-endopeptidase MepM/ murein hydrolase activator NlpD
MRKIINSIEIREQKQGNPTLRMGSRGPSVTQVQQISPLKKAVSVKHGDFFTIYQNLSSVNVQVGDKVSAKQSLGKIRTDADGRTILKFLVSQNSTLFNPTTWLSGR